MRTLLSFITAVGILSSAAVALADDPVERAAERAADAKKDNKPKHDRPQAEPQTSRPDAGDMAGTKRDVEPKAGHGDKVVPARTDAAAHKRHHRRHVDVDKSLHDPTDANSH